MKRVRRTWGEARAIEGKRGFSICLDAKPLRLPGGAPLNVSTLALAEAITLEWMSCPRGKEIGVAKIPLTRLAAVAQERIALNPGPARATLLGYAKTDLLCYRASTPADLVRREAKLWQPWVEWAAMELGAVLRITRGVMPVCQDLEALSALEKGVARLDLPALAALGLAVPALGSLVLGLALATRRISAVEAVSAALLEETFQADVWGKDRAAETRRGAIRADVAIAERFMKLAEV